MRFLLITTLTSLIFLPSLSKINGPLQLLDKISTTPSPIPTVLASGQRFGKMSSKSLVTLPFAPLMSSIITLPGHETTQLEGSFGFEALMPFSSRGKKVVKEKIKRINDSPPKLTKESLDEREESEIDKELGHAGGMAMRLSGDTLTVELQPKYKLTYFDARGICESIRLMFRYANESFVDERLTKRQWLRMKNHTLFGKIPILEVDGKKLSQCYSISRYLAGKFGLIGTNEWDRAKVDEFHRGVVNDVSNYIYVLGGFREGNKDQLRKDVFLPAVDKHFPTYVKLLDENRSGYFGQTLTWVDLTISEFFTTIDQYEPFILKKYPPLIRFVEKIHQLPQLRHYIISRAKTPLA